MQIVSRTTGTVFSHVKRKKSCCARHPHIVMVPMLSLSLQEKEWTDRKGIQKNDPKLNLDRLVNSHLATAKNPKIWRDSNWKVAQSCNFLAVFQLLPDNSLVAWKTVKSFLNLQRVLLAAPWRNQKQCIVNLNGLTSLPLPFRVPLTCLQRIDMLKEKIRPEFSSSTSFRQSIYPEVVFYGHRLILSSREFILFIFCSHLRRDDSPQISTILRFGRLGCIRELLDLQDFQACI